MTIHQKSHDLPNLIDHGFLSNPSCLALFCFASKNRFHVYCRSKTGLHETG